MGETIATAHGQLGIEQRIETLPATPRNHKEYQDASIYALSSRYEGFGLVLVEAMQQGLPVVSTIVLMVQEIVSHGETGLLVPNGDVDAFCRSPFYDDFQPDDEKRCPKEALVQVGVWK